MKTRESKGVHYAFVDNAWVPLTTREKMLIDLLSKTQDRVTTNQIKSSLWGHEYISDSAVKKTIHTLRKKINDDPNEPEYIQNERGIGYLWIHHQPQVNLTGKVLRKLKFDRLRQVLVRIKKHVTSAQIMMTLTISLYGIFVHLMFTHHI